MDTIRVITLILLFVVMFRNIQTARNWKRVERHLRIKIRILDRRIQELEHKTTWTPTLFFPPPKDDKRDG